MAKILNENPPNIEEIRRYFTPPLGTVYAYGDTIYNPSGGEIFDDLIVHEEVHQKQQEAFSSPELWWTKYLVDKDYRKNCEVEAYGKQYQFLKEKVPNKFLKQALFEMADNLRTLYNLDLLYIEAETLIRKYG